ncbi:hypothetical protein AKJ09_11237 [Labilithrix luteola]|uniref:Tyr recombinase domain-containing protein n=1 Tax=Labilithrix luteola TaxID=1391654 RepID=A0A0K1QFN0_9BACT|nr:tyrosine-type recombinase/integrase [Labilithrix luteola]AKV04574.1 hypothetical protein AKJ09_11237 [Labilithrix luteola]
MGKLRASKGGAYESRGSFFMRVTVAPQKRRSELLPWAKSLDEATERAHVVQELVNRLRATQQTDFVDKIVESAATADAEKLAALVRAVDGIVAGKLVKPGPKTGLTFRTFAERWTGGELHRQYPDHVRFKRSADDDISRLEAHVYPVVGDKLLSDDGWLDAALEVMQKLPASLSPASRRHVAQLLSRVFALAVYPCRLLAASPLPRGFLPKLRKRKAKAALYPDEDARLLGTTTIPLPSRVFYGFLAREGMRSSEALHMTWGDLDLTRGAVRLDVNKTDDPRSWALDPGTAEALRRWHRLRGEPAADREVFEQVENRGHLADAFRDHLQVAKIERPELFETTDARRRAWLHDLRATFVTVSLACGRTEAWVTNRTGHRSSGQIATYRRLTQTFQDIGAGELASLAEAIPELSDAAADAAAPVDGSKRASVRTQKTPRKSASVDQKSSLGSAAARRGGSSPFPCTSLVWRRLRRRFAWDRSRDADAEASLGAGLATRTLGSARARAMRAGFVREQTKPS